MPHYYFYGIDIYYLILILPAFILSLFAQIKIKSTFSKYSKIISQNGLTGADAARKVLELNGVSGVMIERVNGSLTDHFDPRTKVIRLSDTVFDSSSVAAIGVAAHEAGHAVQYDREYFPIKARNALVPIVNFGSSFSFIAIFLGFLFSFQPLVLIGIGFFSFAVLFQIITLPVELNASARAVKTIREGALLESENEVKGAKSVLTAAAMTYIAAAIMSVAQLLRLVLISRRRR